MAEPVSDEVRIIVIGKTGVGKSATGNTIIGRIVFQEGETFVSETHRCSWDETIYAQKKTQVVDTPGLYDSDESDFDTVREILKCTALTSPGPHVILWVLRANERFSNMDAKLFPILLLMFGDAIRDHVILVYTYADAINGTVRERMQHAPANLKQIVTDVHGRYVSISNSGDCGSVGRRENRTKLMQEIALLVAVNRGRYFTNDLTQETNALVLGRINEIMSEDHIDFDDARHKFRCSLQKDEEGAFMRVLVGGLGGALAGMAAGAAVGLVGGVPGMLIGGASGAIAGAGASVAATQLCRIM